MTLEFFAAQIERLKSQWPNSFSDERVKLIYSQTKSLPETWLRAFCDNAIGNFRQPPVLSDFLADANAFNSQQSNVVAFIQREEKFAPCSICQDGLVFIETETEGTPTLNVARCTCPRGNKHAIPAILKSVTTHKNTGRDKATGEKDDAHD